MRAALSICTSLHSLLGCARGRCLGSATSFCGAGPQMYSTLKSGDHSTITLRASWPTVDKHCENACSGARHRRRCGWCQHAIPPDEEGLERCRPVGAIGTDGRVHVACGGTVASVQHELHGRAAPQVLCGSVQET